MIHPVKPSRHFILSVPDGLIQGMCISCTGPRCFLSGRKVFRWSWSTGNPNAFVAACNRVTRRPSSHISPVTMSACSVTCVKESDVA
jgi:hypothetical protein